MTARHALGSVGVLLVCAGLALGASCVSAGEFRCDESVAHLVDCCPDFDTTTISCREDLLAFHNGGGGLDIGPTAADCLLEKSCGDVRAKNICTRLAKRVPTSNTPDGSVEDIACAR